MSNNTPNLHLIRTLARLGVVIAAVLALAIATWGALSAAPQQSPHGSSMPNYQKAFEPFETRLDIGPELGAPSGFITADVPILMYHHIGAPYRCQYNIPLSDFEAQMAYLAQNGYTAVSVDQIAAALRGQTTLPPCPVAITFDDGYADVYRNAVPVLRKYGFKANFYLVTNYISVSKTFMSWPQVKELAAQGMSIGSHSMNHSMLSKTSGYTLTRQIAGSKAKLEAQLGISITSFSYPYGGYNGLVLRVVSDAGYTSAVLAAYDYHQNSDRIFKLSRIAVYDNISLPKFIARLPKHGPYGRGACSLPPAAQPARQLKAIEENP